MLATCNSREVRLGGRGESSCAKPGQLEIREAGRQGEVVFIGAFETEVLEVVGQCDGLGDVVKR